MPVSVELLNHTQNQIDSAPIEKRLDSTLRRLGQIDKVGVELIVVNDSEMTKLNQKYRNTAGSTDVLSFDNPTNKEILGSIVISYNQAAPQAKEANLPVIEQISSLVNHGFLHLLGYHHEE
ncbi:MAG TPA: rRNA maturation RNase YbeY [Candidatus Saccharimonadales bacterium]|nr:rRNA maturation RNase YbeY [Candidatus Saccharimonadales bacterium]